MFEHNANLLPWREVGANIKTVKTTKEGDFDYEDLEKLLKQY